MTSRSGRVLVVGDNDLAGLATVRSLGRAGLDVDLVAFERSSVTRSSRYVRRLIRVGHPLASGPTFVAGLLDVVRATPYDLVLPTSDKALLPLIEHRDLIEGHTRLAAPDSEAFEQAHNKQTTLEIASRVGLTIPRSRLLRSVRDLAADVSFPLVLKPVSSFVSSSAHRSSVCIVRSEEQLRERLPGLLLTSEVIAQEFCPGYGVGVSVIANRGEIRVAFQHERVHEPPEGGASSYRRSVPLDPELLDGARRLFGAMAWTGAAMAEFKVDPATGRAVLMEVNGRLWGSVALAIHAGVDFPRLLYDLFVLGDCGPSLAYRSPVYSRHTVRDFYWLQENSRAPRGEVGILHLRPLAILSEIRNILLLRERYDLESLTDPGPAITAWRQLARAAVSKIKRTLGQSHTASKS